ncbi:MAG TPA: ATP-binding protein [Phycisphaerae bacterium]|nr:ATP-binding protein [Phycisphaerae bacterium]
MMDMPIQPVRLCIRSSPLHLPMVRAAVEKMCEALGFDSDSAGSVVLSTDEALTNIIKHAYKGADDKPIEIELGPVNESGQQALRICMRDYGIAVDPARIKSRDLKDVRPGGLGVHIMSECMDSVEYRHAEGGGTLLVMVKDIPSRREEVKS